MAVISRHYSPRCVGKIIFTRNYRGLSVIIFRDTCEIPDTVEPERIWNPYGSPRYTPIRVAVRLQRGLFFFFFRNVGWCNRFVIDVAIRPYLVSSRAHVVYKTNLRSNNLNGPFPLYRKPICVDVAGERTDPVQHVSMNSPCTDNRENYLDKDKNSRQTLIWDRDKQRLKWILSR